jgi:O-antigen/teichoic acid export membrane protein
MFHFGVKYLTASGIDQSRNLAVLFVIGRILGQDAVGHMEISLRAIRLLTPLRAAASRVSVPAFASVASAPKKLNEMLNAGIETEVILGLPIMLLAVWIYPICVHTILGPSWIATIGLFPWIAAAELLSCAHANVLSALHVREYFWESISTNLFRLFCHIALILILGSNAGLVGCAAAGVAAWPAFWLREWIATKRLETHWCRNGVAWAFGGACACLGKLYGFMFLFPLVAIVCVTFPSIQKRLQTISNTIACGWLSGRCNS